MTQPVPPLTKAIPSDRLGRRWGPNEPLDHDRLNGPGDVLRGMALGVAPPRQIIEPMVAAPQVVVTGAATAVATSKLVQVFDVDSNTGKIGVVEVLPALDSGDATAEPPILPAPDGGLEFAVGADDANALFDAYAGMGLRSGFFGFFGYGPVSVLEPDTMRAFFEAKKVRGFWLLGRPELTCLRLEFDSMHDSLPDALNCIHPDDPEKIVVVARPELLRQLLTSHNQTTFSQTLFSAQRRTAEPGPESEDQEILPVYSTDPGDFITCIGPMNTGITNTTNGARNNVVLQAVDSRAWGEVPQ